MHTRSVIALAVIIAGVGMVGPASSSTPVLSERPVVNFTLQWGRDRQASTTMPVAQIPAVGEVIDTISESWPTRLRGQWTVIRVIHTPGNEAQDALVIARRGVS